ncbi:MAG: Flagellar basal-body rod protein FlgC [Synergistales bacterium 53_16]|jgi:flagellar basal-body rod protein FlgC|nr:MAG: Flagellar basal-body rod protein FlgC [Synergistales bacterium 53_16]MDN5335034.1 flagellar basal-body rod protein FlgC [Synergistales bacterium]
MRVFKPIDIAGSGLTAHRAMLDVISENLANANTTRTEDGGPYMRKVPVFEERLVEAERGRMEGQGVIVKEIGVEDTPPRMVYDPGHPDADEEGYVAYPNVSVIREMADMMAASRAYEANLEVVESAKAMWEAATELLGR